MPLKAAAASPEDIGSKGYWISMYGEVRPESSQLAQRAHDVFRRILKASDRRKGVEPGLVIINYSGRPWAQSIADGTVVLTKNAVDFCYKGVDTEEGDTRLSFVLGHELAHQFNGDFWHFRFFQAAEAQGAERSKAFDEIRGIVKNSDNLMIKELQADQYGALFAYLAGYDIDTLISGSQNFYKEWALATDPLGAFQGKLHLSPEQRAAAVTSSLKEVTRRIAVFRAGVVAYYIGMFEESIAMMEEFARFYPSREVLNNIGAAYLSVAYENYKLWKGEDAIPFKFSFGVDSFTSAESIEIGRPELESKNLYSVRYADAIDKTGDYLRRAIESGSDYILARNNLGCAYMLDGRFHEAVAIFEEALALSPGNNEILNNNGIAYYYLADKLRAPNLKEKARRNFKKAVSADKGLEAASYNLMIMNGAVNEGLTVSLDSPTVHSSSDSFRKVRLGMGVRIGEPVPVDIKKSVKKGYIHTIKESGSVNLIIYDLSDRGMIVVERNGKAEVVILRNAGALKNIEELAQKSEPAKRFIFENRELWLSPTDGVGIELIGKKAVAGFMYSTTHP